jgi:hypothetical protein
MPGRRKARHPERSSRSQIASIERSPTRSSRAKVAAKAMGSSRSRQSSLPPRLRQRRHADQPGVADKGGQQVFQRRAIRPSFGGPDLGQAFGDPFQRMRNLCFGTMFA